MIVRKSEAGEFSKSIGLKSLKTIPRNRRCATCAAMITRGLFGLYQLGRKHRARYLLSQKDTQTELIFAMCDSRSSILISLAEVLYVAFFLDPVNKKGIAENLLKIGSISAESFDACLQFMKEMNFALIELGRDESSRDLKTLLTSIHDVATDAYEYELTLSNLVVLMRAFRRGRVRPSATTSQ